jgi:hypothetical protein
MMAECTCPDCSCKNTWICLHSGRNPVRLPSGELTYFCKCCVTDEELPLDEDTGHMAEFTKMSSSEGAISVAQAAVETPKAAKT